MKIVISGIGEMGSHLARMLSGNGHDITVIDSDSKALNELGNLADLITVEGDTTTFAVLRRAGVRRCDLYIAVNHDENINILSAIMAKQLGAKTIMSIWNPITKRCSLIWALITSSTPSRWLLWR